MAAKFTVPRSPKILLSTACIILQAPNGQSITVRALLDSGAEESFVTEHVAQAVSLGKTEVNIVISDVGGAATAVSKGRVAVKVKSAHEPNFCLTFSALVHSKLTAVIPRLSLADPHFGQPARIDCILNSEAYAAALLPGIKKGAPGTPTAFHSVFD